MICYRLNQHGLSCNSVRACIAGRATRICWFSCLLGALSLPLVVLVFCPLIAQRCFPIAVPCASPSVFCFLLCVLQITARMSHNWTAQASCVSLCNETRSLLRVESCMLLSCVSFHSSGGVNIVDLKYNDVDLVPHQVLFDFEGLINICVLCLESTTYRTTGSNLYMLKLTEGTLLLRTLLACHGEVYRDLNVVVSVRD